MKRLFALALSIGLFGPPSALAGPIKDTTKCATIHEMVLDGSEADLKAVYKQILRTLTELDRPFVSILTEDGRLSIAGVVENLCAQHSDETLRDATARAYSSFRGRQRLTNPRVSTVDPRGLGSFPVPIVR